MTRQLYLLTLLIVFIVCRIAEAQRFDDSVRVVYNVAVQQEQKVVLNRMNLVGAERISFAKVYEPYCREKETLEIQYLQIITLQEKFGNVLSEKDAARLYAAQLHNDYLLSKMRKHYYNSFAKILGPSRASGFMDLDQSFRLSLRTRYKGEDRFSNLQREMEGTKHF